MRFLILAISAIVLAGCPFGGVNQINRIPASELLSEPQLINRPGILNHEPTGFAFPEWYDNFQRVTAYQYDSAGLNVSVGYNDRWDDCLVAATFYIYPAPRMSFIGANPSVVASLQEGWLRDDFERSKHEIEVAHPDLREPSVRNSFVQLSDVLIQGPWFGFAEAANSSELRVHLYDRQWFLKYRFTYPQACKTESLTRISALTRQLPWAAAQQATVARLSSRRGPPATVSGLGRWR